MNGILTHDWAFVVMLLECVKQCGCKAKVACHELLVVFGSVDACEVEHDVAVLAVVVEFLWRCVQVVFVDGFYGVLGVLRGYQLWVRFVTASLDGFEVLYEVAAYEAFCAGD